MLNLLLGCRTVEGMLLVSNKYIRQNKFKHQRNKQWILEIPMKETKTKRDYIWFLEGQDRLVVEKIKQLDFSKCSQWETLRRKLYRRWTSLLDEAMIPRQI